MQARFSLLMLLSAMLLILFAGSCGTSNSGGAGLNLQPQQNQRVTGVAVGGFEVIRQNEQGNNDSALNPTLALDLKTEGNETALAISVTDASFTTAVALDINYDATRFHPVRTEFAPLLGSSDDVLSASFLDSTSGTAGLAAVAIGDYRPAALAGQFATVYFAPGPDRAVSAVAGDAHENPLGVADVLDNVNLPNLSTSPADPPAAGSLTIEWTAAWMIGNGDGNKEVNGSDLTPLGQVFRGRTTESFAAIKGDFNRDTEANLSDLQRIGAYFKRFTDAYLITASDDDGSGQVTVATLDGFDDQQAAQAPPTAGVLKSVFPFWNFTFDSSSSFTFAQLQALDVDGDGDVRISITPKALAGAADGVTSDIVVTVGVSVPPQNQLVINGFAISVNDGAGVPTELAVLDATNDTLAVTANDSIGFTLESINGSYNGTPFTGRPAADPVPPAVGLTQAEYDAAFSAAEGLVISEFTTGGDLSARRTQEWCTFSSGSSPYLGILPGSGTVFPDYDPESVSPTSEEGTLVCTLPIEGGSLPGGGTATYPETADLKITVIGSPVIRTFKFDVEQDPEQAQLVDVTVDNEGAGNPNDLILNRRNVIRMQSFSWGSLGEPADFNTVQLQMFRIAASGLVTGAPLNFTHVDSPDAAALNVGQFTIKAVTPPGGDTIYAFYGVVNGAALIQGASYAVRFVVDGKASSINIPETMLLTAPPPPPQPMVTIPSTLGESNDYVQLFYQDPTIRRNGAMTPALGPPPERLPIFRVDDQAAFDDVLRTDGDEFVPGYDVTVDPAVPYPVVVVKNNADGPITGVSDPGAEPGIFVLERGANRIVIDVTILTFGGGGPDDPPIIYNFMVYDRNNVELGSGSFTYAPQFSFPVPPGNLEWGINVWDREAQTLAAAVWDPALDPSLRILNADDLDTPQVPVLFIKFAGGSPYNYIQDEEGIEGGMAAVSNPFVYIENLSDSRTMSSLFALRVAGVAPDGAYIMIHTITANDFYRVGAPGVGILIPGEVYDMYLMDFATNPGLVKDNNLKFADQLLVTGTSPWD